MLNLFYEDQEIIVVEKPAGMDSQASRGFSPDMVSELKTYLCTKLSTDWGKLSTKPQEKSAEPVVPYLGVIHRLDKPVSGVMVFAKTPKAAANLSHQVREGKMNKIYYAVVCGKPVDNVGNFVDYLQKDEHNNLSRIVDKSKRGAKRAELEYKVIQCRTIEQKLSLVRVHLLTGRHHQIRVQFAGHGCPLWGDNRYNPDFVNGRLQGSIALCAASLSFIHPSTGERKTFAITPKDGAFAWFDAYDEFFCVY